MEAPAYRHGDMRAVGGSLWVLFIDGADSPRRSPRPPTTCKPRPTERAWIMEAHAELLQRLNKAFSLITPKATQSRVSLETTPPASSQYTRSWVKPSTLLPLQTP
ncbi:unnamed protein product [Arctogadus glacialis]